jgi:lysozyme
MAYNLGLNRLRGFKQLRHYLQQGDYEKAANEMVDSMWYGQVGERAQRLVDDMRVG